MSAHYLIRLETPSGSALAELEDKHGFLDDVLIPYVGNSHGVARHIDPYGTTIFNAAQSEDLLKDCKQLAAKKGLEIQHESTLENLSALLYRVVNEVHLRVFFLGH